MQICRKTSGHSAYPFELRSRRKISGTTDTFYRTAPCASSSCIVMLSPTRRTSYIAGLSQVAYIGISSGFIGQKFSNGEFVAFEELFEHVTARAHREEVGHSEFKA